MRIVRDLNQVSSSFDSCQREALTAFGRNEVFLEGAYHILLRRSKYIHTLYLSVLLHAVASTTHSYRILGRY